LVESNHCRKSLIFLQASYQVSIHLQSGFREEDFLEINQSETRIAFGDHVCQRIGTKLANFSQKNLLLCNRLAK
jgi:hypothetical protein